MAPIYKRWWQYSKLTCHSSCMQKLPWLQGAPLQLQNQPWSHGAELEVPGKNVQKVWGIGSWTFKLTGQSWSSPGGLHNFSNGDTMYVMLFIMSPFPSLFGATCSWASPSHYSRASRLQSSLICIDASFPALQLLQPTTQRLNMNTMNGSPQVSTCKFRGENHINIHYKSL